MGSTERNISNKWTYTPAIVALINHMERDSGNMINIIENTPIPPNGTYSNNRVKERFFFKTPKHTQTKAFKPY